jgi:predicted dehydrogenase
VSDAPPVRWGFLGAGFVASRALAPAVHATDGATLQVVAARDDARAATLEPTRAAARYDEVCTADDVDAVYISLPNDAHLPWVLIALEAGKHVLCEKPLALSLEQVLAMRDAAERADRLLVEATWSRWHPRTRRAQEVLDAAGGPRVVRSWFTFEGVPETNYRLDPALGGGALLDVGSYTVGAAHWALGADDTALDVVAAEQRVGPTGVDLATTAVLARGDDRAHVTASIDAPESQGLTVETPDLTVELVEPAFTSWGEPSTLRLVERGREHIETFEACDAYRLMVEAVSARIRGEDAWVLPLATSEAVARSIDAVITNARNA